MLECDREARGKGGVEEVQMYSTREVFLMHGHMVMHGMGKAEEIFFKPTILGNMTSGTLLRLWRPWAWTCRAWRSA